MTPNFSAVVLEPRQVYAFLKACPYGACPSMFPRIVEEPLEQDFTAGS